MKIFKMILVSIFFINFLLPAPIAFSAPKFKVKVPKQSYSRQVGGNAKQKTKVEYDRGGKRYSKNVNPGQTKFIPRDASNISVNGMRVKQGERVTISPNGAKLFED